MGLSRTTVKRVLNKDLGLTNLVEPVSHSMFNNRHWVFQQDSAPAHRAKSTQDWLTAREIDFIRHEDWPSSSPDLSPLDYKIWQHLEEKACSKPHPNLESHKISLIKVVRGVHIEPAHIVKKRSIDQPLRISIFYDDSVYRLELEKFVLVNNTILPEAVKFWEQALKVRKTGGPIKLNR
ncbi:hypothetical protein evm_010890 [Chilo suppressalis]|nr:hypothetical protein evm_010890 [Chilo suppressalis]